MGDVMEATELVSLGCRIWILPLPLLRCCEAWGAKGCIPGLFLGFEADDLRPPRWVLSKYYHQDWDHIWGLVGEDPLSTSHWIWDVGECKGISPTSCFGLISQTFTAPVRDSQSLSGMASISRVVTTLGVTKTSFVMTNFLVATLFLGNLKHLIIQY